jgi:endonuclease YncB( thermonuclease family)
VIGANPRSETAWLWLSAIVDDPDKERDCLERVLRINPDNEIAQQHLDKLNQATTAEPQPQPLEPPQESAQELPIPPATPAAKSKKRSWWIWMFGALGVVALLICGLASVFLSRSGTLTSLWETPTSVQPPTATLIPLITPTTTVASDPTSQLARVTQIVDGDTIEVEIDGQHYRLRYIGIDTPEQGELFSSEATEANRRLVQGRAVQLEKDVSETDSYGRLLRYVYLEDGTLVNAELVRQGYAQVVTYPPDVKHHDLFLGLQTEARDAGRGLWA